MEIIKEGQLILKDLWYYPKIDLFHALFYWDNKWQNFPKSFSIKFLQSFQTLTPSIIFQKQYRSKLRLSRQNTSPKFLDLILDVWDDLKLLLCWQFINDEYEFLFSLISELIFIILWEIFLDDFFYGLEYFCYNYFWWLYLDDEVNYVFVEDSGLLGARGF